jgi:predicted GNAT family N-acyltransferase
MRAFIAPCDACLSAAFGQFCSPMVQTVISEAGCEAERALAFAIRREVFVVEQGISEALEFDGRDGAARHLLARRGGEPVGSLRLRLLEHGRVAKIERVAVRAAARRHGVGHALLEAALALARAAGAREARLHAQCTAQRFYGALGFVAEGPTFIEDGIAHVAMRLDLAGEERARWCR